MAKRKTKSAAQPIEIALAIDLSASMFSVKHELAEAVRHINDTIISEAPPGSMVRAYTFSGVVVRSLFGRVSPDQAKATLAHWLPTTAGMTPLKAAIRTAIVDLNDPSLAGRPRLLIVITDGEETSDNSGATHKTTQLLVQAANDNPYWTVTAQGPPHSRRSLEGLGFQPGNIATWIPSREGTQHMGTVTARSVGTFTQEVKRGATSTDSFYVQPNLSKTDASHLPDVRGQYLEFVVPKEARIDAFVNQHATKGYVIGAAYYELMKDEKVQATKDVVLQHRTTGAIHAGPEIRPLVGLPIGGTAKVIPGNHGDYRIYIQSRSVNRRLPRGTHVLVNRSLSTPLPPTWDHTQLPGVKA